MLEQNPLTQALNDLEKQKTQTPLDTALTQLSTTAQHKANVNFAATQSPDLYATSIKAQQKLGIPPVVTQDAQPEVDQRLKLHQLAMDLANSHSKVKDYFGADPHALTVAQDDLPMLSKISNVLEELETPGFAKGAATKSYNFIKEAIFTAPEAAQSLARSTLSLLMSANMYLDKGVRDPSDANYRKNLYAIVEKDMANEEKVLSDRQGVTPTENLVLEGLKGAQKYAVPTLAGLISGAPVIVGGGLAGVVAGGEAHSQALEQGFPEKTAAKLGLANAGLQAAFSALPLHLVSEMLSAGRSPLTVLLTRVITGQIAMQGQTALQPVLDESIKNPDKSLYQFIKEHDFVQPAFDSLVVGLSMEAVTGGSLGYVQRSELAKAKAEIVSNHAKALMTLDTLAASSKLKERAPNVLEHFARTIIDGDIHLSANDLVDILEKHQVALQEVRDKVPAIDDQIDAALEVGGDVVIPVSQWLAGMAGEKYNQDVIPKARVGDSEMSAEDLKEFGDKENKDAEAALEEAQKIEEHRTQVQQIQDKIAQQLVAARPDLYDAETAATSAALQGAWYSTLAQDLGVEPAEAFAKYPVKIEAVKDIESHTPGAVAIGHIDFVQTIATIRLTPNAKLTTFLHESGHLFLQTYIELARNPNAPTVFKERLAIILKELGGPAFTANPESGFVSVPRAAHEQFAESFEEYLFTGKAPNDSLRSVFRMFTNWFKNVYQALSQMRFSFSPEVREVVDRMLGAGTAVDIAETQLRAKPLFTKREQANVTDEEWIEYQNLGIETTEKAIETLQKRSLRDMTWLRKSRSRMLKKLQEKFEGSRKEAREEAEAEVRQRPERQLEEFLKTGKIADKKLDVHKIDLEELENFYKPLEEDNAPVPEWRKLIEKHFTMKKGLSADDIAGLFKEKFASGDDMIRKLLALNPIDADIEALTDLMMLEQHGDVYNPETFERAVDTAIHNDARIRMAASELKFLGEAVNLTKMAKAAREYAARAVGRKQVGMLRPRDFELAETRSGNKAILALEKGDNVEAAMHKRNQILNGIAAKFAAQAIDNIKAEVRYMRKFRKPALVKAIGGDTVDQVNALLSQFGFKQQATTSQQSLADWVAEQQKPGYDPQIADWIDKVPATPYSNLTVDQFNEVTAAIRSIETVGRNRQKLLATTQAIAFEEAENKMVEGIKAGARRVVKQTITEKKGWAETLKRWKSELNLFPSVLREIGGWQNDKDYYSSIFYKALDRPFHDAVDFESKESRGAFKELNRLQAKYLKGANRKVDVPTVGTMTRNDAIMVTLYAGSPESYQRLIDGGIYSVTDKLTPDQITAIADSLTKDETLYVQSVLDLNESFRPKIIAQKKELLGFAPKMIEAKVIETRHGNLPGGYIHIEYDYRRSGQAKDSAAEAQEEYDNMRMGRYVGKTTAQGHLKERQAVIKNHPTLSLDTKVISRSIQRTIHDLAFYHWAIDSYRLLHSDKVAKAMREYHPESTLRNLKQYRENAVRGEQANFGAGNQALRLARKTSAVITLGYNFMSGAKQVIGWTQAIPRVGASWLAVGALEAMRNSTRLELPTTRALRESEFMKNNHNAFSSDMALFKQKLEATSKFKRVVDKTTGFVISDLGFAWLRGMNTLTNSIVWYGAEAKAKYKLKMAEPKDIVAYADDQVRDTQGSGSNYDKTLFESTPGGEFWSMFWTFFARTYNLSREIKGKQRSMKDLPRTAYHFGMMLGVASILNSIAGALKSDDPDKALMPDAVALDFAAYLLNAVPVAREFSGAVQGYDYKGPAATRVIIEAIKALSEAEKFVKGE